MVSIHVSSPLIYKRNSHAIYRIRNTVNGAFYIGSAVCVKNRMAKHFSDLRKGKHGNSKMQNSFNKYGAEAFVFEVLEPVIAKTLLIEREQFYMDHLKPTLNIRTIAESCLGMKASEETKRKMSEARRGEKSCWYGVRGEANPLYGRKQPDHLKALWSSMRVGELNPMHGVTPAHAKLVPEAVKFIKEMIAEGYKNKDIVNMMGISKLNVSQIRCGRAYKGVTI